jgi:hypothetical protein
MQRENSPGKCYLFLLVFSFPLLFILACNLPHTLVDKDQYVCEEAGGTWTIDEDGNGKVKCIFNTPNGEQISPDGGDQPDDIKPEEINKIPAGTYTGESNLLAFIDNGTGYLPPVCSEDTVKVVIAKDGTVQGELRNTCSKLEENDWGDKRVTIHNELTGLIQGQLSDVSGQLKVVYTQHMYATFPTGDRFSETLTDVEFRYNVNVSNGVMTFKIDGEPGDFGSFVLYK